MLFRGGSCRRGSGPSAGAVHKVPTEADANAEEHADIWTKDVGSQQPSEHHLCRLYCLSEAVGWTLHGAAIVLAGTRKSSLARRRLTPGEASPSQDRRSAGRRLAPISSPASAAARPRACGASARVVSS